MKRSSLVAALVLLPLLLFCSLAAPRAAATRLIPEGRWTVYHVPSIVQDDWSPWYSVGPWPVRYRFKCSKGAIIINASNTSNDQQGAPVLAWDAEADEASLDRAIDDGWAEHNAGFGLGAGQSTTFYLYRPSLCGSGATRGIVFAVVYGR